MGRDARVPGLLTMEELLQLAKAVGAHAAPGLLVLVGSEIGLCVILMGREAPAFVDALARLNQEVPAVAGRLLAMKGNPHRHNPRGRCAACFRLTSEPHLPSTPPDTPE